MGREPLQGIARPLQDIEVSQKKVLARTHSHLTSEDCSSGLDCKPAKKFHPTPTENEQELVSGALGLLLKAALPDKEIFIAGWLRSLAAPSVCITSVEDVKDIDMEDLDSLPVPPCVKRVLRQVNADAAAELFEQQAVLDLTAARAKAFLAPLRDRNQQPPVAGSKYFQDHKNYRLILTKEEIEAGVRIVAHRLETWCKGERIMLVGILKGAFMFMSDLCRALTRPYSVQFIEASSYKDSRTQGEFSILSDISGAKFVDGVSKEKKKIVIVDELLDNGKTMHDTKMYFLNKLRATHTENDILTVCLFSKKRAREWPDADITGIPNLPDLWLVGYGLDDRGTKRGWTELFAVPKVKLVRSIEQEEVLRLLGVLDDEAALTETHVFSSFELPFNSKCRYRVCGLDMQGGHELGMLALEGDATSVKSKRDIERLLAGVECVKGKYEHELQFAFIADNVTVVSEDSIFHGNNRIYAEMRCRLRKGIQTTTRRCRVQCFNEKE
jgi:hypoxanthine phosphoribosyltransferase